MTPPAAVVEKMVRAVCYESDPENIVMHVLNAAAEAGWALVSKGLIEEAVNGLTRHSSVDNAFDIASRLRSALGNGGAP